MRKESKTMVAASRIASVGAVWLATRVLETQKGRKISRKLDRRLDSARSSAEKSLALASRNVRSHSRWTTAGLAAIALGGAMLVRAARS